MLAKPEWLDRYRSGDLVNRSFSWERTDVRAHADTVFVRGVQSQDAHYRGEDCSGRFLATLMAVRQDRRWAIVNLQLSMLDERGPEPGEAGEPAEPRDDRPPSATCGTEIGQVADVVDER